MPLVRIPFFDVLSLFKSSCLAIAKIELSQQVIKHQKYTVIQLVMLEVAQQFTRVEVVLEFTRVEAEIELTVAAPKRQQKQDGVDVRFTRELYFCFALLVPQGVQPYI